MFVDGEFRADLSALPAAVEFSRFAEHGEFGTLACPDGEPLVALNTMLAEDGAVVSVPAGVDAGLVLLVERRDRSCRLPSAAHNPSGARALA